jgi:curved DNA-binding protein CbpA
MNEVSTVKGPPAEGMDAYRTLQLMPSAPHDLIEQAYWVLVGRVRAGGSHSGRLGRLNDAYATLINPERRAAYDLEHGLSKLRTRPKLEMPKRPMFARKPKFTTRLTHYQLLDIDFEASPEVVDTAYVFHKAQLRRSDPRSVYLRALLEDAYATLSSPQRRGQYDDKVAPRKRTQETTPAPSPTFEPPAPKPLFPEAPPVADASGAVRAADGAPVAGPPSATETKPRRTIRGWLSERLSVRVSDPDRVRPHSDRARQLEARLDMLEAEHKRLADLGLLGDRPASIAAEEQPAIAARAQFRFTDGPQRGETIALTENSIILGASDAADVVLANPDGMIGAGHVRVWRREDEYILHQLDSFSTTYVNGERLDLRLAILEPGDEIRIGPHTLIFDQAPAPVEAPAEAAAT